MLKHFLLSIFCSVIFLSCDNELHMLFPEGPAGMSAYEVWVEEVLAGNIDWPEDRTDVNNFFLYLKGEDGKNGSNGKSAYELWLEEVARGLDNPHNPGHEWPKDQTDLNDFWYYLSEADGENGVTPNIGENGNWWINGEDTGIPAQGKDGQNGATPVIGENGNWWIGGVDTGVPAYGEDGATPEIGSNGNWWIDGVDTGIPAQGKDGQDGQDGEMPNITIGSNGNWYINGEDTGVPAQGKDGQDGNDGNDGEPGTNGQSAYELWVQEVKAGNVYKNDKLWPTDRTTVATHTQIEVADDGTGHNYNNCRVQIKRKFIYTELKYLDKAKVEKSADYWGDYGTSKYRYARIGIEGCYGENIMLQSYIKLLPAQFTPTISEMTRGEFYGSGDKRNLVELEGNLDVSKVNEELFLADDYKKASQGVGGLDVYEPVKRDIDAAGDIFKINFSSSTTSTNIVQSKVNIGGTFQAESVNINSTVDLTNNQMANFYNLPLGNINGASGTLYLRVNGNYVSAPEGVGDNGIEIQVK